MKLKSAINRGLERTGYQIVRAETAQRFKAAKVNASTRSKPSEPSARRSEFPRDYDETEREIIRAVQPYTMTSHYKLHSLIIATRYISAHKIPGAIVECGVWRGGSMQAVARTLLSLGDVERDLYLFDTFEGMPPPTEKDLRHDGRSAAELLAESSRDARIWAIASLEDVKAGFEAIPYPSRRIHYVQGLIETTIPAEAPSQIALLRLDTDWYESTKHELNHLYPRLVSGGVLIIDDYGQWQGSRQATDEFLAETGARLLLNPMTTGRIAVKP